MPIFSYDGNWIYFSGLARDNAGNSEMDLYRIPAHGGTEQKIPGCSQPGKFEYYQSIDENGFFYASQVDGETGDRVFYKNTKSDLPPVLMPFNEGSETADPCVVNDDYTIVSSIRYGGVGGYDLYLCDKQTGKAFPLSLWNSGINTDKNELAAWYIPQNQEPSADGIIIDVVSSSGNSLIEISNLTDNAISTKGLYLTDDEDDLFRWQMPAFIIKPGESILFRGAENSLTPVLKRAQVNFDVSAAENLSLADAAENIVACWSLY
jgi:hypothetical protein